MVIICVLGSYVDGLYGYSQAKPPRCSTIFKIKDNLVILFFLDLNIIFNLSHPSNHSQTSTKCTLNRLTFTFNPLKVNNTSFTL